MIENQVRTIDIMPTALDLLKIDYDETVENQMQGVSLVSLINGEDLLLDAFSETDYLLHTFKRSLKTNNGWKYIYSIDTEQKELYKVGMHLTPVGTTYSMSHYGGLPRKFARI